MSEVNIVAILYPAEGKAERMKELLAGMCADVHSKEDYTLRYMMTEQLDSKNPDIIMIETYKSNEASLKHSKEPHFQSLFGQLEKEKCMAKAPYIARTVTKAGFDIDHKLISKI